MYFRTKFMRQSYMNIENYQAILEELKVRQVGLIAVSKSKTIDEIMQMYKLGQRIFGENKGQESYCQSTKHCQKIFNGI